MLKRIGPLAVIIIAAFYLIAFYLFAISNTPENPFASVYSESFIETACQYLLLLVGFDTLIYRKYYDTPPILVGHQPANHTTRNCSWMQRAGKEGALPPAPPLSGANVQAMPVHQHQQGQYVGNQPMPSQQQGVYVGNHLMPAQ